MLVASISQCQLLSPSRTVSSAAMAALVRVFVGSGNFFFFSSCG
jgi:hypothetical protein